MLKEAVEEDGGHQAGEEDEGSDVSGYHSDSDSAIMMSGNSPYVSKHARFNFLTRSGKSRPCRPPVPGEAEGSSSLVLLVNGWLTLLR